MGIYDRAAWALISGLALMLVGGLVLWAYGARRVEGFDPERLKNLGPEGEATRLFHVQLTRWFLVYGTLVIVAGIALLMWACRIYF